MRKFLLSSISLFALASPSFADDTETVVVTATRTPQPLSRTGQSLTVITAEGLEGQQVNVASDILQETPGLMINRNGGVGQLGTVSLRGAEPGQTVVLIDGIRINDPSATDGIALISDILVNNIDRIEILRGPQSTLYGSDAIGGVVNILTKRGAPEDLALTLSTEGGAFDTYHLNAAAAGTFDRIDYGVGINLYGTRGVSAADSRNGNPEPDGYKNIGATTNMRIHATDNVSIDLRGFYSHGRAQFDDNFIFLPPSVFRVADSGANNRQELFTGYAGINIDLFGGVFQNRFAMIGTENRRFYFDSAFDTIHLNSDDLGTSLRFEYQGVVDVEPLTQLVFGAETEHTGFRGDSFSSFFPSTTDKGSSRITGYYFEAQHRLLDQVTLTAGVRYDDDPKFGTHTSTKFAAAWAIPDEVSRGVGLDSWRIHANYGDGFKAPSLFQQFSEFSNPITQLKPETARGWEFGTDTTLSPFGTPVTMSLVYFERHTTNMIDFVNCPGGGPGCATRPFGFYDNVGRTRASGFEAEATIHPIDTISFSANYTNLSAVDLTMSPHQALIRRPHNKANATLSWTPDTDWSLTASITYAGPRFDDPGVRLRLADYTLADIFGSWEMTDHFELFARVENLLDRHYEPEFGYGAPGRGIFAGLRARI